MPTPLIEFRNVTKRFGALTVLDKVDLEIFEGEVTTIIGLSGAGKSVLLRHIIGLLKPDEGEIYFRSNSLAAMNKKELNRNFATISYMFQGNALFDSMTIFENIAMPLRETTDLQPEEINKLVMTRIEQMELEHAVQSFPSELSGGMQKRAALARALVTDPSIVLFDEPTSGQDPVRTNAILSMIAEYQKKLNFTAILVSHAIPDVFFISNRILAIYERKIVFQGTPEAFESFNHPFKDEMSRSLEALQQELTGLYSRRQFKLRHRLELMNHTFEESYVIIVLTLNDLEALVSESGYEPAQEAMRCLGVFIDKHFGAAGGFSTRRGLNEFVTVLPYSDTDEATELLGSFINDFQTLGAKSIMSCRKNGAQSACINFGISVGMAQGRPITGIDSIVETAKVNQKEIARIACGPEGVE